MVHTKRQHDRNHAALSAAALRIGATVKDTSGLGGGFPDAVIGFKGKNYLFEFKMPGKKRNDTQKIYHILWAGKIYTVETVAEMLNILIS